MAKNNLTAINLRNTLWETLQGVKSKRLDPKRANAIAGVSREILRVIRAEITVTQLTGGKPNAGLIGFSGPK